MLNTVGWITFYWHWKHLAAATNNLELWQARSTSWLNSGQLINGYSPSGIKAFAVWDWIFLFGHLIWATGFMFLIS